MELYLLDGNFSCVGMVTEAYWCRVTRRFFSPGDMVFAPRENDLPLAGEYVYDPVSGYCGVIEGFKYDGGITEVHSRSLEALLERRIIHGGGRFSGSVESAVRLAVTRNAIDERNLAGLVLGDTIGLTDRGYMETSWSVLSEWIYSVLRPCGASFAVELDMEQRVPKFNLTRYENRTRGQKKLPPVVFSESLGNVRDLYVEKDRGSFSNTAYVRGPDNTCVKVTLPNTMAADAREKFVSAGDIYPEYYETTYEYESALKRRGTECLLKSPELLRGKGIIVSGGVIGRDFNLGDLCDFECSGGVSFSANITSVTYTYENGDVSVVCGFGEDEKDLRSTVRDVFSSIIH